MKQNIIHIGLDVDDKQYHGSALNQITGEILDFKCRPNLKGLLGQLDKLHKYFPGSTFKGTDKLTYKDRRGYHIECVLERVKV